jgi:transcriptional regulator with XRE-family HTH domain
MAETAKPEFSAQYEYLRKLLAIARKKRGLTQREIARRMGQPPSFVGKIENGTRGIDVVEFVAWSKAADTKPQMVLTKLLKRWPEPEQKPE